MKKINFLYMLLLTIFFCSCKPIDIDDYNYQVAFTKIKQSTVKFTVDNESTEDTAVVSFFEEYRDGLREIGEPQVFYLRSNKTYEFEVPKGTVIVGVYTKDVVEDFLLTWE